MHPESDSLLAPHVLAAVGPGPVGLLAWAFPSGGVQPYEVGSALHAVLAGSVLRS